MGHINKSPAKGRNREKQLASQRRCYHRNPKRYQKMIKDRMVRMTKWIAELRDTLQCKCGESHPACLDFHHRDSTLKDVPIALAARRGWSKTRILKEIAKCDVLCSNCHRKLHFEERMKKKLNAPVVQRIERCASNAENAGLIPVRRSMLA